MITYEENQTPVGIRFTNTETGESGIYEGHPLHTEMMRQIVAGEAEIIPSPEPSDEEKVAAYRAAVGRHIDQQAQSFGFDSIVTAVTYADEPADPLNQSYGQALRAWRSECWEHCRTVLADWQGGGAEPTEQDLIDGLPAFVAP